MAFHVDAVHLLRGGQQVNLAPPFLRGKFFAAGFQFFQIPGRRVIENQFPAVALLEQFPLLRFYLGKLLMDSLVLVVLRPLISPRSVRTAIRRSALTISRRRS